MIVLHEGWTCIILWSTVIDDNPNEHFHDKVNLEVQTLVKVGLSSDSLTGFLFCNLCKKHLPFHKLRTSVKWGTWIVSSDSWPCNTDSSGCICVFQVDDDEDDDDLDFEDGDDDDEEDK